jgi:hypothetical protein
MNNTQLIILKQKFNTLIKIFLLSTKDYSIFYNYLNDLKTKFPNENLINKINNNLYEVLRTYNENSIDTFIRNICINNENNENLINDLINFFNPTIELENRINILEQQNRINIHEQQNIINKINILEQQNIILQKDIAEIKSINLSQNNYIERIDENTNK